jgi:4-hydroxybutyrate CoA-transferase
MMSDGVKQLCKSGNINGKKKNFYPNLVVFTFAAGSAELYEWMNHNPLLLGLEVEYCNDSYTIAQNDNLVAINGAVCVDLLGQVSADTIAGKNQSGAGGQVDFIRGANMSKGGRSFICMPSTAQGGKVSRIVPSMDSATQPVTTSLYDVDFVATEHGVAKLRGKTHTYRREALIEIAAPEFRDWLRDEAKRLYKYITPKTRIHNL